MTLHPRQERLAERLAEDEALRGNLDDRAAAALLDWAISQALAAAADPARPDAAVEAEIAAIRAAARKAAAAPGLSGEQVLAQAQHELALTSGQSAAAALLAPETPPAPTRRQRISQFLWESWQRLARRE